MEQQNFLRALENLISRGNTTSISGGGVPAGSSATAPPGTVQAQQGAGQEERVEVICWVDRVYIFFSLSLV